MTLAEKITKLRKEQGWSQEELAMRLDVTRQSVSKWESMASLPDLDKILGMSRLFGVSTDYLLKDEAPPENGCTNGDDTVSAATRAVTLEQANQYLTTVRSAATQIAGGVSLCILSPTLLIALSLAAQWELLPLSEGTAAGVGVGVLLAMVAWAVVLLLSNGMRLSPYEFLETEAIHTQYGVAGMAQARRDGYEKTYRRLFLTGIVLCIVSSLPLLAAAAAGNEFLVGCAVISIFPIVALGVCLIVRTAFIWGSFQKLLEEGEYTREKKAAAKKNEPFVVFYWCLALAVYLAASFLTRRWDSTWVVWPVAAVLFAAALALISMLRKKT